VDWRAALACAIPMTLTAGAAGPAARKVSGTYEVVHVCDPGQKCLPPEKRHWTLVLLDEAATDEPAPGIAVCSRRGGFASRGCFFQDAARDTTLREVVWSAEKGRVRVGLECGEDYGQRLLFRAGAASGTWRAEYCCRQDKAGKSMMTHIDATVAVKRAGAADPERCRR
jgi:hypothetical protein